MPMVAICRASVRREWSRAMTKRFDIQEDELPIFLAESEEHIGALESGLLMLEQGGTDAQLVNDLFRSAHTLKGMAGMIGHERLVTLTHALETAFDGLRKGSLRLDPRLMDWFLSTVDALRVVRDEVEQEGPSQIDVAAFSEQFDQLASGGRPAEPATPSASTRSAEDTAMAVAGASPAGASGGVGKGQELLIEAEISPQSVASAARALQVVLAVQPLGEILSLEPSLEEIESARPVSLLNLVVKTEKEPAELENAVRDVSDVSHVRVTSLSRETGRPEGASTMRQGNEPGVEGTTHGTPPRLGELLVAKGLISESQLEEALRRQKVAGPDAPHLGKILVEAGWLSQEALDGALFEIMESQRQALEKGPAENGESAKERSGDKTIRINVERLDALISLVGELIVERNRLNGIQQALMDETGENERLSALEESVSHVGRISDLLQDEVMHLRMVPISNVFSRFPRLVRDLAQKTGKSVRLDVEGQETELDRSVAEAIQDPLVHLLRNAVDHGIEPPEERTRHGKPQTGVVRLAARHVQGRLEIVVEDDGQGIDTERLKAAAVAKGLLSEAEAQALPYEKALALIFRSGLSTAKSVSEISGRGVGMDIVENNIERVGGSIAVHSVPGEGTSFRLELPLTLAIVPALLVEHAGLILAFPLISVVEALRLNPSEVKSVHGQTAILLRDQLLPVLDLGGALGLQQGGSLADDAYCVVLESNRKRMGVMVEELLGREELVVKPLGPVLGKVPGVSGGAILGDGQVALVADPKDWMGRDAFVN